MEVDFVLSRLVGQKKIRVLDVGAHYGEMIQILRRATHRHHFEVICIEPLPANLRILRRKAFRTSLRPNFKIQVIPAALSNFNGLATFYVGSEDALVTNSARHMERFAEDFIDHQEIEIQCIQAKELERQFSVSFDIEFDLVKIDIEGQDLIALDSLLSSGLTSKCIMIEFHFADGYFHPISKLLSNYDYSEQYLFVRDGISTTYVGNFSNDKLLQKWAEDGLDFYGNCIAFRNA